MTLSDPGLNGSGVNGARPPGWANPGTLVQRLSAKAARLDSRRVAAVGGLVVVALAAAFATTRWPLFAIGGLVAIVGVAFLLNRLALAVALLSASFYFNNYLDKGAGIVTPAKAIGGLAVLAWILAWGLGRARGVGTRQLWPIGGLVLWVCISLTAARDQHAALTTTVRYLLFFILFFLVLQAVQGERRKAEILVTAAVAAAAVSGGLGLVYFFGHQGARARGPVNDPNDFAYLLGATLPLAIYRFRWCVTSLTKALSAVALVLILGAMLFTFSRTGLIGLGAAAAWALVTRRLRLRWLALAVVALGAIVGLALAIKPTLITNAFTLKSHAANTNVTTRYDYWFVALEEFGRQPITGVGPGNYNIRFQDFAAVPATTAGQFNLGTTQITGENAYFNVLAELGAPGLALFLTFLALSWKDLRRRFPSDPRADGLQTALAAGFVAAVIGAFFLTEQFYPPMWFLSALGASMAAGLVKPGSREPGSAPERALANATTT